MAAPPNSLVHALYTVYTISGDSASRVANAPTPIACAALSMRWQHSTPSEPKGSIVISADVPTEPCCVGSMWKLAPPTTVTLACAADADEPATRLLV